MTWDKRERLDELGVTGAQRDFVMDLLQLCDDVFGLSMTPTVGINENGDVGVAIQGVSGTINITITRDCYVFFAGDLRALKGDKDGTTN